MLSLFLHLSNFKKTEPLDLHPQRNKMFLEPFSKGPCQLTYVLLFTIIWGTLKPIDYPTFPGDLILVLGGHQYPELIGIYGIIMADSNMTIAYEGDIAVAYVLAHMQKGWVYGPM